MLSIVPLLPRAVGAFAHPPHPPIHLSTYKYRRYICLRTNTEGSYQGCGSLSVTVWPPYSSRQQYMSFNDSTPEIAPFLIGTIPIRNSYVQPHKCADLKWLWLQGLYDFPLSPLSGYLCDSSVELSAPQVIKYYASTPLQSFVGGLNRRDNSTAR